MSIQKEIVLRYRAAGHVRFQLPERLCEKHPADLLRQEILRFDGVYRVNLYRRQGKLSIRYTPEICPFAALAKQLFDLINDLKGKGHLDRKTYEQPAHSMAGRFTEKLNNLRATRWAKDKYADTKETAKAVGILAKLGLKNKPELLQNPEKAFIDFFNDVLVLYLIKTHWHTITQQWLLKPLRYRYEWMASFYLMYLLVRSKLPKK